MHCVDTSGWLDGWRRFYPRDVFPSLWDAIEERITKGEIVSSEEVYVELAKQDDDLHEWIKNRSQADPFVIATAMFRNATVVTGELQGTERRPRIPDVCQAEGVPCINFLQMLRDFGLTF
jgi:hypothetical protein